MLALLLPASATAVPTDYSATPVGLLVTPELTGRYAEQLANRQLVYEPTFRNPVQENGHTVVDCQSDRWIGVALLIQRSRIRNLHDRRPLIRHKWSHPEFDGRPDILDHSHRLRFAHRGESTLTWEVFDIDGRFRVNGTWTLRSYVYGKLVSELDFTLVNCPEQVLPGEDVVAAGEGSDVESDDSSYAEEEIVCRREKPIGSNIRQTVCRVRSDIDSRRERDQDMMRDMQRTPDGPSRR